MLNLDETIRFIETMKMGGSGDMNMGSNTGMTSMGSNSTMASKGSMDMGSGGDKMPMPMIMWMMHMTFYQSNEFCVLIKGFNSNGSHS